MTHRPRPHMPLSVKLDSALIALGLEPGHVDFDHCPALRLREFDPKTGEYSPPANDPQYITPRARPDHRDKTKGDAKQIAAKRRQERKLGEKVEKQAARWEKGRQILQAAAEGKAFEKDMRPAEKRKAKFPRGQKLPRKNKNGQKTATRPLKTARRFR